MTPKIIAIDDDPTGSQTVHSCLLLLDYSIETLVAGLKDASPLLFILANTRALPAPQAAEVTRIVCQNLKVALAITGITSYLLISRSDSTLRGHYPLETDVIAQELGPFDAHFLIPAFLEGGRITRESVHYLLVQGQPFPVHQTEFAQDAVFGFRHSYLPDYVAEKTQGRTPADQVIRFCLPEIRRGCLEHLLTLTDNRCGVVDAEIPSDLQAFAQDLLQATQQGKKFLLRSAAGIIAALAGLPPQPIAPEAMAHYTRGLRPGVVLVGSHVPMSTQQVAELLKEPGTAAVEIPVGDLLTGATADNLLAQTLAHLHQVYAQGLTPVVFTSREELQFSDTTQRLNFGITVSSLTWGLVQQLPEDLGFLVSKGGITSNDVLSKGLALTSARLLGQIMPGVSVICTAPDHPRYALLPVVIFPGNVGGPEGLALVYRRLSNVRI